MKRIIIAFAIVFLFVSVAMAAGPKTYQVTGPVLEKKDGVIVVQKGKDKWEIATTKGHEDQGRPEGRLQGHHRVHDDCRQRRREGGGQEGRRESPSQKVTKRINLASDDGGLAGRSGRHLIHPLPVTEQHGGLWPRNPPPSSLPKAPKKFTSTRKWPTATV